jgi:putative transposase
VSGEIEAVVVRFAQENSRWGYDRIVGALTNTGHHISDQTVGNILRRHGIAPAPKRSQTTTWKDFLASHMAVLAGITRHPTEQWMEQMARNLTDADSGGLCQYRYVLHDHNTKFCASFRVA